MLSLRVSVQRTALPVSRASQPTRMSSVESVLAPKPPPTSRAITRTSDGSSPSARGEPVAVRVRRLGREPDVAGGRPRRRRAADERGSSGAGAIRWLTTRPRDDDLAALEQVLVGSDRDVRADVRADLREEQGLAAQRLDRVDERRQRVVLDEDELGGVDCSLRRCRRARSRRSRPRSGRCRSRPGGLRHARLDPRVVRRERLDADVGRGQHARALDHARVDAVDARVRERRADEGHVERALELEVVDVRAPRRVRKRGSSLRRTR